MMMLGMPTKACPKCGMILWIITFGRDKTRKDGRAAYCKPCFRRYFRVWRAKREKAALDRFLPGDGNDQR
jgi:hypothetical protein